MHKKNPNLYHPMKKFETIKKVDADEVECEAVIVQKSTIKALYDIMHAMPYNSCFSVFDCGAHDKQMKKTFLVSCYNYQKSPCADILSALARADKSILNFARKVAEKMTRTRVNEFKRASLYLAIK